MALPFNDLESSEVYRRSVWLLSDLTNKFFYIDHSELAGTQRNAWSKEYDDLIICLQGKKGRVIVEYNIPSLSKTIDVVVLLEGKIFVLEYKTGDSKETISAVRQVEQYSLLLKYCHSTSNYNWIIPILIATGEEAQDNTYSGTEEDRVYNTLVAIYRQETETAFLASNRHELPQCQPYSAI